MFAASLPSEVPLQALRVRGGVRMHFAHTVRGTHAASVHEAEGWRARFPATGTQCEAVILNTGGGIAGGDEVTLACELNAGASVTTTTVAGERVYRALEEPARLTTQLHLGPASALAWLPRETILSSGAKLMRRIEVDMAASARLTLLDIVVFGRRGAGERMESGTFADRWTIRRDGRVAHAEAVRLNGAIAATMEASAIAAGAHVTGTLLHIAPDAEEALDRIRETLAQCANVDCAASAWDGKLVIRALAHHSAPMRAAMQAATETLTGRAMPRVWLM